jgi:tetratricopeptide (TPR) repeat protein
MRNPQEAERAYQEVLRIDPRQTQVYLELFGFYLEARNLHKAEKTLWQSIQHLPLEKEYLRHQYDIIRARILTR